MKFELVNERMATPFLVEDSALAGVKRIANIVAKDIELVTGKKPEMIQKPVGTNLVIVGTLGQSEIIESLHQTKKINCDSIRGKREVFLFQLVENPMEHVEKVLVVVGSDKRGTIYGLFHISELLGVSPFIYWGDVKPEKKNTVVFDETVNMVSKEPSVKYRGFFINDEWPAFGTWTFEQFGGFTSEMYEHVFEVLLRLKGNYLWPAMWSSSFYLDGPGLANAELADEMGVIIGLSHHEPCLRT